MKKNKHLLLWSSLGTLALLIYAAVDENFLREWRSLQEQMYTDAGPIDERLRQVVAPKLKAVDRCVTCHVGMAPGETGVRGHPAALAHRAVVHDPAEFGCTVCHGGQGRATEKADAHGKVAFWPKPMIPLQYAYAGCGSCHTHIAVPNQNELARGRNALERSDCMACHRIDGRGGTLRPGGAGGMEGPDLSLVGMKGFDGNWYEKHLARSGAGAERAWQYSFAALSPEDRDWIGVYLNSRVGAPLLVEAKALFHSLGCRGCHKLNGVGGDDGPDLSREGDKDPGQLNFAGVRGAHTLDNWLREHFRNPFMVVPGSRMPAFGLDEAQIDLLTFYMLSLRRSEMPEALWPKDRIRAERFGVREFKTDGATLFATFCAACHGQSGEGRRYPGMQLVPAIANPDFLAIASDSFLEATLMRGRPSRRMPPWGEKEGGLRSDELRTLVTFLRSMSGVQESKPRHAEARWVRGDVELGRSLYSSVCAGCHGQKGEGPEAPQLNNPVFLGSSSDEYLIETIRRGRRGTAMQAFSASSPTHPAFSEKELEALVSFIRTWEKQP